MSLERLQQLADDFAGVPPTTFEQVAEDCWDLAIARLDVRYMVLAECLRLSGSFWGDGEAGAVSASFATALTRVWTAYLPAVLEDPREEEATAAALALLEELNMLATHDPVGYGMPSN